MNIAALLPLIQAIISLAVQIVPELAKEVDVIMGLLQQQTPITAEQQAQIDAALDAVNAKLDEAIKAKLA